jgi:hypothetical protein
VEGSPPPRDRRPDHRPAAIDRGRAAAGAGDRRLRFSPGAAEHLPYGDGAFDLVRHKARTRRRAERLLRAAGFPSPAWHRVDAVIIQAVTATKEVAAP